MALKASVLEEAQEHVRVVYMTRAIAKYWNHSKHRNPDEPAVFCGFYWINGKDEGGPFKSASAAWRDAWYRVHLESEPPLINERTFRRNAV